MSNAAAARRVYENWRPLDLFPPVHVLKYDARPAVNKLVDARNRAKRVSLLVHTDFINLAYKPTWYPLDFHAPPTKPCKTRIQLFVTLTERSP